MVGRVRLKDSCSGVQMDEELPSLLEVVFKYLADNLDIVCHKRCDTDEFELNEGVVIPNEICDRFLKFQQDCNQDISDHFIDIFRDTRKTPLKYVQLRNSSITDEGIKVLMRHNLTALSMWYCNAVTPACWETIVAYGQNLKYLELGKFVDILRHAEPNEKCPLEPAITFPLPNLQKLVLHSVVLTKETSFACLSQLKHLDLSGCILMDFGLSELQALPHLQTLILFNVWPLEQEFPVLCKLQGLRKLDLSIARLNTVGTYVNPNRILTELVESLPNLTDLDISGTNLAGNGVAQQTKGEDHNMRGSDIPGLISRANKPLQFLGLYNAAHSACRRFDIPARIIAGEADENQILTAAVVYQDRQELLTKVLNDLYHLLRFESCKQIHRALDVVLNAMDKHIRVKYIQISGSATLFYIVKGKDKAKFGTPLKNHIIRTLLNGMSEWLKDDTMMRNGCLTLCQFSIPYDVLFEYERLVKILLHGVSDTEQEGFVQRIAIYLINSLACQVDGNQKSFLGQLGAIKTMLNLIEDRLNRNVFDDVMEVAWSTMWNVTDETAVNCERFLDGQGMMYFLKCLKTFPEREELLRNMMGLLGNVAEVEGLRPRLMTQEFITVFSDLLNSCSDGIEVSYNAAGVLSHIASDGPDAWKIPSPTREEVLQNMVEAISRWQLDAERNINYRSFEPILKLVECYDTPQCQHWAVWALANLTKVYPCKYCPLVEREGGLRLLRELIEHPKPYQEIKNLANMVIEAHQKNLEETNEENEMIIDG
ncbi:protein zer-1 homolog [Culicoides brevitarsis]|uniref:protein zer-1 homolog n=1 Tax=Culicoides brevitarsis TaxID=469753 RepID=UPI00307C731D